MNLSVEISQREPDAGKKMRFRGVWWWPLLCLLFVAAVSTQEEEETEKEEVKASSGPKKPVFREPNYPSGDVYFVETFTDSDKVWKRSIARVEM